MGEDDLAGQAEALCAHHRGRRPLVLPNAWDVASAHLVERHGFPAVATSSGAVAATFGYADDDSMPVDEAFGVINRIARAVGIPVTADLEAGYQLPAEELAARLLAAGAVGCNLEDADHHGSHRLVDAHGHAERLVGLKAAAQGADVNIVLNARVDVFRGQSEATGDLIDEAIRRARLYVEAGADCIYPITLADERAIAQLVEAIPAPINILLRPSGPSVARLGELGVRRISLAGGVFRAAYGAVEQALAELNRQIPEG